MLRDRAATSCVRHESDILCGLVINLKAACKGAGCRKQSLWELTSKHLTRRGRHGPLEDALVFTAVTASRERRRSSPASHTEWGPQFQVKI